MRRTANGVSSVHLSSSGESGQDWFGVDAVQHPDPEVRQAGQELVLLLYKADQETVRAEMPEDNNWNRRSHANRYVFEQMDQYDKKHGRRHRER